VAATAAAADVLAGDCRQRMSVGCRDVYRLLTPSSSEEGSSIPDHRLTLNDSAAFPFDSYEPGCLYAWLLLTEPFPLIDPLPIWLQLASILSFVVQQ